MIIQTLNEVIPTEKASQTSLSDPDSVHAYYSLSLHPADSSERLTQNLKRWQNNMVEAQVIEYKMVRPLCICNILSSAWTSK